MKASTRHWMTRLAAVLAVLFVGAGCGGEAVEQDGTERQESTTPLNEKVFVSVDEFETIRAAGATVIDVRDAEKFDAGHVPGSVQATWDVFKDTSRDGAYAEDDPVLVEEVARSLGISHDVPVLIYGDAITTSSARQAWALEYYGHAEVYILDGGFSAWETESGLSAQTEAISPEPGTFTVEFRPELLADEAEITAALDGGDRTVIFFDARSFPEYEGTDDRDNPRHGHIPGAIHYEWTNVFQEDGKLRPKEELRAELEQAGLLVDDALIIPYCQGGFRSAVVYSVLRWLGRDDVSNYDGSWYEYSRRNGLPVE